MAGESSEKSGIDAGKLAQGGVRERDSLLREALSGDGDLALIVDGLCLSYEDWCASAVVSSPGGETGPAPWDLFPAVLAAS